MSYQWDAWAGVRGVNAGENARAPGLGFLADGRKVVAPATA